MLSGDWFIKQALRCREGAKRDGDWLEMRRLIFLEETRGLEWSINTGCLSQEEFWTGYQMTEEGAGE